MVASEDTLAESSSEEKDDKGTETLEKLYTEEDLAKRLRGQGSKIKELQLELGKYQEEKKKQEEAELTKDQRITRLEEELNKRAEILAEKEKKEQDRLQVIGEQNEKRIKDLPKIYKSLVPPLDPDILDSWLDKLDSYIHSQSREVYGGGGRKVEPEDQSDRIRKAGESWIFGKGITK